MKNILIFILLLTGLLSYLYESRKPKPKTEAEIRSELETEWAEQSEMEDGTSGGATSGTDQKAEMQAIDAYLQEEIRAALKAELAAEVKQQLLAEMPPPTPTPAPEPTPTPYDLPQPEPETPEPEIVAIPEPTPTPTPPGPDIKGMEQHIATLGKRVALMKETIRDHEQVLSLQKSRIISWKKSVQNKYQDDTFSITKTRAELQKINAAERDWWTEKRRQDRRKTHLENAEKDLAAKKAYLNQVR